MAISRRCTFDKDHRLLRQVYEAILYNLPQETDHENLSPPTQAPHFIFLLIRIPVFLSTFCTARQGDSARRLGNLLGPKDRAIFARAAPLGIPEYGRGDTILRSFKQRLEESNCPGRTIFQCVK